MKTFVWDLTTTIRGIRTNEGNHLPVLIEGRRIGQCIISKDYEGRVYGHFDLSEDANPDYYVLYSVSNWEEETQLHLEYILFVHHFQGIEKRAKTIQMMHEDYTDSGEVG